MNKMLREFQRIGKSISLYAILMYSLFVGASFLLVKLTENIFVLHFIVWVLAIFGSLWTIFLLICYLINFGGK